MRKNIFFVTFMVLLIGLILTGCGAKKELICKNSTPSVDISFNLKYESNKFKKFKISYSIDLSKYSESQKEDFLKQELCLIIENSMNFKGAFKGCNQKQSGNKLLINTDVNISKIDSTILKDFDDINDAKTGLETKGFTCNIIE